MSRVAAIALAAAAVGWIVVMPFAKDPLHSSTLYAAFIPVLAIGLMLYGGVSLAIDAYLKGPLRIAAALAWLAGGTLFAYAGAILLVALAIGLANRAGVGVILPMGKPLIYFFWVGIGVAAVLRVVSLISRRRAQAA